MAELTAQLAFKETKKKDARDPRLLELLAKTQARVLKDQSSSFNLKVLREEVEFEAAKSKKNWEGTKKNKSKAKKMQLAKEVEEQELPDDEEQDLPIVSLLLHCKLGRQFWFLTLWDCETQPDSNAQHPKDLCPKLISEYKDAVALGTAACRDCLDNPDHAHIGWHQVFREFLDLRTKDIHRIPGLKKGFVDECKIPAKEEAKVRNRLTTLWRLAEKAVKEGGVDPVTAAQGRDVEGQ